MTDFGTEKNINETLKNYEFYASLKSIDKYIEIAMKEANEQILLKAYPNNNLELYIDNLLKIHQLLHTDNIISADLWKNPTSENHKMIVDYRNKHPDFIGQIHDALGCAETIKTASYLLDSILHH